MADSVADPGRHSLVIDEMMIGTRCRISFLQYLPQKAHEVWHQGVGKLRSSDWVCPHSTFQVYTGKTTSSGGKGLAHSVVMDLMQRKGHKLFVDNFYSSIPLFLELLENGTFATGTFVAGRKGFPEELLSIRGALMLMDDLKVYEELEEAMIEALAKVEEVSGCLRMTLGLRKCGVAHMAGGGGEGVIPEVGEEQSYRCLEVHQQFGARLKARSL